MKGDNQVIIGDKRRNGQHQRAPGITSPDFWDGIFPAGDNYADADKLLDFPDIDDPAGIFQRAVFKSDEQKAAMIQLWNLAEKHGITRAKQAIRNECAASRGWMGFGTMVHLQGVNGMMVPGVTRQQLGLKKIKGEDDIEAGGSDFRQPRQVEVHDR